MHARLKLPPRLTRAHARTTATASLPSVSGIRLHMYDHCPYCTRVQLVLGWRSIPYERQVYGYADVNGPSKLSGKKVLPILEWQGSQGERHVMRESTDIVRWLDVLEGPEHQIIAPEAGRRDLKAWQKRFRKVVHHLTRPRLIRMPIGDFATPEDAQYQMDKYIARGFSYESALTRTDQLLLRMDAILRDFPELLHGERSLNASGWSWDDLYTLPSLRVLTCVAGLTWPERALRYVSTAHDMAGVDLYFDHAC